MRRRIVYAGPREDSEGLGQGWVSILETGLNLYTQKRVSDNQRRAAEAEAEAASKNLKRAQQAAELKAIASGGESSPFGLASFSSLMPLLMLAGVGVGVYVLATGHHRR